MFLNKILKKKFISKNNFKETCMSLYLSASLTFSLSFSFLFSLFAKINVSARVTHAESAGADKMIGNPSDTTARVVHAIEFTRRSQIKAKAMSTHLCVNTPVVKRARAHLFP